MSKLAEKIQADFAAKKIVVVGDLVADQFLSGTISRVSREAPVFILRHDETETLCGGAANAAVNAASLGANVFLVGLTGNDPNGRSLIDALQKLSVNTDFVLTAPDFKTTTKVRVLAGQHYAPRQQVIRIDYENQSEIDSVFQKELLENFRSASQNADAIIISDYNYGVANAELAELAKTIADKNNIPLLVDSRFRLENFAGATSATPNQEEVEEILGKELDENSCAALCKKLGYKSLLVTLGNKGMILFEDGKEPLHLDSVGSKEPIDVTGAGDTVIAAYALGLASGLGFADAAKIANYAGGIVVMKKGTASVTIDELLNAVNKG